MFFIGQREILEGQGIILSPEGSLDSNTSPECEMVINKLLDGGYRFFAINGLKISHVSSSGIGLLLLLERRLNSMNGVIVYFNLTREIVHMLDLLNLNEMFQIAHSEEMALDRLNQHLKLNHPLDSTSGQNSDSQLNRTGLRSGTPCEPISDGREHLAQSGDTFVVSCPRCKGLVNVAGQGDYLCPHCRSALYIEADNTVTSSDTFDPFVTECTNCKTLIRLRHSGTYQCPDCKVQFNVLPDQTIIFPNSH